MKRITGLFIVLVVLFFIVGYILVILNCLEQTVYNQIATIVGGLASTVGLLAFVLPTFKTSDIKSIELSTLKSLTKTAEEIQKKETELNIKQNDITKLELQKQELEFLVKKASLNLFLKEQLERYYETLDKQISYNKEITGTLSEIKELEYKINELDIEIDKSPNTEYILQIIREARNHRNTSLAILTPLDLFVKVFSRILKV